MTFYFNLQKDCCVHKKRVFPLFFVGQIFCSGVHHDGGVSFGHLAVKKDTNCRVPRWPIADWVLLGNGVQLVHHHPDSGWIRSLNIKSFSSSSLEDTDYALDLQLLVSTKTLPPLLAILRSRGIPIVWNLNDFLLQPKLYCEQRKRVFPLFIGRQNFCSSVHQDDGVSFGHLAVKRDTKCRLPRWPPIAFGVLLGSGVQPVYIHPYSEGIWRDFKSWYILAELLALSSWPGWSPRPAPGIPGEVINAARTYQDLKSTWTQRHIMKRCACHYHETQHLHAVVNHCCVQRFFLCLLEDKASSLVFTRLIGSVLAILRLRGIPIGGYPDDLLLHMESYLELESNLSITIWTLDGFQVLISPHWDHETSRRMLKEKCGNLK